MENYNIRDMQGWETAARDGGGTVAPFHNLLLWITEVTILAQQEFKKN